MNIKRISLFGLLGAMLAVVANPAVLTFFTSNLLFSSAHAKELVRMSPRIREYDSTLGGPGISVRDLRSFIPKMVIFDDDMEGAGELVDFFESALGRPGGRIEAAGLEEYRQLSRFDIYQPCVPIDNPDGRGDLGCLTKLTAQATRVSSTRRTDILRIDATYNEVFRGQSIIPRVASSASSISNLYRVEHPVSGKVAEIVEGLAASAQYRVVVINLGIKDRVSDGAVLTIYRNNQNPESFLPDLRPKWRHAVSNEVISIGQVVLFDVFEKASLGLILYSESEVAKHDFVRN